jgi:hypothetical protein
LSHKYSPSDAYAIPKKGDSHLTDPEQYASNLIKGLYSQEKLGENARSIEGCDLVTFNNNFVFLLDQAYKSFLMGMHYSAVSLCGMAIERLCYDFIWFSEISFEQKLLTDKQKKFINNIALRKLIDFIHELDYIDNNVRNKMIKINDMRNKYVHPTLEKIEPFDDAKFCLNNLCNIVDFISEKIKNS